MTKEVSSVIADILRREFPDLTGFADAEIIQEQGPRKRSCEGKVRYGHQESAEQAAAAMKEKRGSELEAYECKHCEGWHVGHSNAAYRFTFKLDPS